MQDRIGRRRVGLWAVAVAAIVLGGCATYSPKPLPTRPSLAHSVSRLTVNLDPRLPLKRHVVDPSRGFDMTDVTILAVVNNPDLKLTRDAAGIARAQAFAAGLLPDPQLNLASDFPTSGIASSNAFNLGLGFDFRALLTHASTTAASRAESRKADLELLWQEWQVISRARLLFVHAVENAKTLKVLRDQRQLFETRYRRTRTAQRHGNATLTTTSQEFAAVQDIDRQINDLQRKMEKNHHDLNTLLGLEPNVKLPLRGSATVAAITPTAAAAAIRRLPQCRPDLLALKAGYQAQEEKLRGAILKQFPALTVGITRARDTSSVYTGGFAITINLPIFNRNRGNIAIETATRRKLYDMFQTRLNTADADVAQLIDDRRLVRQQLKEVRKGLAGLEEVNRRAQQAFDAGNFDILAYTNLRGALLRKRLERIALEQSVLESNVALQTLVGCGASQAAGTGNK
ncbi:MAG: TolC family protein [Burkholderiales bacterium]